MSQHLSQRPRCNPRRWVGHRLPLQSCLQPCSEATSFLCVILSTRHLALEMMPRERQRQRGASCNALLVKRWGRPSQQRKKKHDRLSHLRAICMMMKQSRQSVSTSEDDHLKLIASTHDAQSRTRLDMRATTDHTSFWTTARNCSGANHDR